MQPLVSVIVPVYNVELYLEQCINSLLKQTLSNIEIILIDDKSTDNSPKICDRYASLYKNIKVIHKFKNEGLGMACNTGIENATGEYIAFCDSDDYVDPDMYEKMYDCAKTYHSNAVFSGIKRVSYDGKYLGKLAHPQEFKQYKREEKNSLLIDLIASEPHENTERKMQVSAKVVLYDRELIQEKKIRFVSEKLLPSEDLIFNIDFIANSNIVCILPDAFYNYRVNPKSISQTIDKNRFFLLKNLYDYIYKQCCKHKIEGNYINRIQKMFLGYTRSYIFRVAKSSLTLKEKRNIFLHICNDDIWKDFWDIYPITKTSTYNLLFFISIRYKFYIIIYLMAIIKKIIKK